MKLSSPQKEIYGKERLNAIEAQRLAQEIAFGPVVFQVSRLMVKFGILELLSKEKEGLTLEQTAEKTGLSLYAVQVLLEASLTIGTVLLKDGRFFIAKAGYFLQNDKMVRVNMDFNHDVNYLGLFKLEEALLNGKPEGLKVFGDWPTIYEGLSSLPPEVRDSWFGFDHFYSDNAFDAALEIVFSKQPASLLDVGGNTGRWAVKCVNHSPEVAVTVMDLPRQIELMKDAIENQPAGDRIHGHAANLLDKNVPFPTGFDAIWMSQFLDCFSEKEIVGILSRAAVSMDGNSRLYIMETFWDRQRFETASYCLTQISPYFTAMANGNSKMYYSGDMERCVREAGLEIAAIHDHLGLGHSIMECRLAKKRKYLIAGTGGVGGSIAGFLALDGKDVTCIARGQHLTALRQQGLKLRSTLKGEQTIPIKSCTAEAYKDKADVIFVCVKAYSLESIAGLIRNAAHENTLVIPVLNVFGTGEKLAQLTGLPSVLSGCIYIVGFVSGPGEVTQAGKVFRLLFGARKGQAIMEAELKNIQAELQHSGIKTVLSDDINRDTFIKWSFISAMACTGAYYDIPMGPLQKQGKERDTFTGLSVESTEIGRKLGLPIPANQVELHLKVLDALTPDSTASMQKDMAKGNQSEIRDLLFAMIDLAKKNGVETPVYDKVAGKFTDFR